MRCGVTFPKGTFVFPRFGVANFDAEVFESPDAFDITRPATHKHLTFGSGIHHCLGASLARAEMQEALPLLAQRLPNLRLDGEITWKPDTNGIWGPDVLPIAFG